MQRQDLFTASGLRSLRTGLRGSQREIDGSLHGEGPIACEGGLLPSQAGLHA